MRDLSSTSDFTVLSLSVKHIGGVSELTVNLDFLEWCFDFFQKKIIRNYHSVVKFYV